MLAMVEAMRSVKYSKSQPHRARDTISLRRAQVGVYAEVGAAPAKGKFSTSALTPLPSCCTSAATGGTFSSSTIDEERRVNWLSPVQSRWLGGSSSRL